MLAIVGALHVFVALLIFYRCRTTVARVSVNQRVNVAALEQLLTRKLVESRTSKFHTDSQIVKVVWIDSRRPAIAVDLPDDPPIRSAWDVLERVVRSVQWRLQRLLGLRCGRKSRLTRSTSYYSVSPS
ncbi:hypothetical protein PINS_up023063, partial [Pythium insidiosum]